MLSSSLVDKEKWGEKGRNKNGLPSTNICIPWNDEQHRGVKTKQLEYELWDNVQGNKEMNMQDTLSGHTYSANAKTIVSISPQPADVCWAGTSLQLPILRVSSKRWQIDGNSNGFRCNGKGEYICKGGVSAFFFSVPAFCGVVKRGTGLSCGLRRMTLNVKNRSDSGDDEKHTVCPLQKFWKVLMRMEMKCVWGQ